MKADTTFELLVANLAKESQTVLYRKIVLAALVSEDCLMQRCLPARDILGVMDSSSKIKKMNDVMV